MKLLFLADNFPPEKNAQASRVFERACYWVQWGHDVTVVTGAPNFPEGKVYPGYRNRWYQVEDISGIRVVRVKTFIAANAGCVRRILDFLSYMIMAFLVGLFQPRPDVVAATSPQFFAAVGAWALSKVRRLPFVFELSDLWPDSIVAVGAMRAGFALRLLERFELFLYRQAVAVVALTQAFRDNLIRRGIDARKITVVTNGVDMSKFSPRPSNKALAAEWGIAPEDFVVAYIGTLGMAHGLVNVVHAAALVRNPRIHFLFVGPGAERKRLIDETVRLGLANVIFVPPQPKERMPDFWSITDLALVHLKDSPLFKTVLPSKIFEAMGMARPILLVAPEGEATRIVLGEGVGVSVSPADPAALAEAVEQLERNRPRTAALADASRKAAAGHTRERQAREMVEAIQLALPELGRAREPVSVSN